ncbi:MAG TPA: hemolysin family protein [Longimicrobiales bacterium]|nr:hemolysin family protein [Longimicrobiales bacterium]
MDPASILFKTLAAICLLGVSAGLIAAQNSLNILRRARIERLARVGEVRARFVAAALERPHEFLGVARAGEWLGAVGFGILAYHTLHGTIPPLAGIFDPTAAAALTQHAPWASHAAALLAATVFVLWLHATIAEHLPRLITADTAERVALWTAQPILFTASKFRPIFRVTGGLTRAASRALGLGDRVAPPPDEPDSAADAAEDEMISGVLEFRERVAREVMTPRPDIVALPIDATRDQVIELALRKQHSRIPIYVDQLDNVVGVLLIKDLLAHLAAGDPASFDLRRLMREPYFVPDTKPVSELLAEFRARKIHLAIVLDEFGGTAGLVTLEDLIEEIVGDIFDEYDLPVPEFTFTAEGDVLIDGGASIAEVNQRFGLDLPEQDYDTIGGYVFGELGRIPTVGDTVPASDVRELRVEEIQDRRVTRLRLTAAQPAAETA